MVERSGAFERGLDVNLQVFFDALLATNSAKRCGRSVTSSASSSGKACASGAPREGSAVCCDFFEAMPWSYRKKSVWLVSC